MEIVLVFIVFVFVTALVLGWLAVCAVAMIVRLFAGIVTAPFRMAKRADAAAYHRLVHAPRPRVQRGDDVQCGNRSCLARMPDEARYCARCGTALARKQAPLPALVVDVRRHGFSQVA